MLKTYIKLLIENVTKELKNEQQNIIHEMITKLNVHFPEVIFVYQNLQIRPTFEILCNLSLENKDEIQNLNKIRSILNNIANNHNYELLSEYDKLKNPNKWRSEWISKDDRLLHMFQFVINENSFHKQSFEVEQLPKNLFHLTPPEKMQTILDNGLIPSKQQSVTGSRVYTPRIYVATNIDFVDWYSEHMYAVHRTWFKLLIINTSLLPKSMPFYKDEEFTNENFFPTKLNGLVIPASLYTFDAIPSNALSIYKTIH
jgi:hypothetical protein